MNLKCSKSLASFKNSFSSSANHHNNYTEFEEKYDHEYRSNPRNSHQQSERQENTLKFIESLQIIYKGEQFNFGTENCQQESSTNCYSINDSGFSQMNKAKEFIKFVSDLNEKKQVKENQLEFLREQLNKERCKICQTIQNLYSLEEQESQLYSDIKEQIELSNGDIRREKINTAFIRQKELMDSFERLKEIIEDHCKKMEQNGLIDANRTQNEESQKQLLGSVRRILEEKGKELFLISEFEDIMKWISENLSMGNEELLGIISRREEITIENEQLEGWIESMRNSDSMMEQQINLRKVWLCLKNQICKVNELIYESENQLQQLLSQSNQITKQQQQFNISTSQQHQISLNFASSKNELLTELTCKEMLKTALEESGFRALSQIESLFRGDELAEQIIIEVEFLEEVKNNANKKEIDRIKGIIESLQAVVIEEIKEYFEELSQFKLSQFQNSNTNLTKKQLLLEGNITPKVKEMLSKCFDVRDLLNCIVSNIKRKEEQSSIGEAVIGIIAARKGEFAKEFYGGVERKTQIMMLQKLSEQQLNIEEQMNQRRKDIYDMKCKQSTMISEADKIEQLTLPFFEVQAPLNMRNGVFEESNSRLNLTLLNMNHTHPKLEGSNSLKIQKDYQYYQQQFYRKNKVDEVFKRLDQLYQSSVTDSNRILELKEKQQSYRQSLSEHTNKIQQSASLIFDFNLLLKSIAKQLAYNYLELLTQKPHEQQVDEEQDEEDNPDFTNESVVSQIQQIIGNHLKIQESLQFLISGECFTYEVNLRRIQSEIQKAQQDQQKLLKREEELVLPLEKEIMNIKQCIQLAEKGQGDQQNNNLKKSDDKYFQQQRQQEQNYEPYCQNLLKNKVGLSYSTADGISQLNNQEKLGDLSNLQGVFKQQRNQSSTSDLKGRGLTMSDLQQQPLEKFINKNKFTYETCTKKSNSYTIFSQEKSQKSNIHKKVMKYLETESFDDCQTGEQLKEGVDIFKMFQINSGNLVNNKLFDPLSSNQKHPSLCGYGQRVIKIEEDCIQFIQQKNNLIDLVINKGECTNIYIPPITIDIIKSKYYLKNIPSASSSSSSSQINSSKIHFVQFIPFGLELKGKGRIECLSPSLYLFKKTYKMLTSSLDLF